MNKRGLAYHWMFYHWMFIFILILIGSLLGLMFLKPQFKKPEWQGEWECLEYKQKIIGYKDCKLIDFNMKYPEHHYVVTADEVCDHLYSGSRHVFSKDEGIFTDWKGNWWRKIYCCIPEVKDTNICTKRVWIERRVKE
ncbi:MAG: hypothetical protein ACTSV7_14020 [Candidatus Baldrarchaeia archaeon]